MLLAIDVGNTNSVFALYNGDATQSVPSHSPNTAKAEKPIAQWRTSTSTQRTADEYAVWLFQLMTMEGFSLKDVSACIISTVVPQSLFHLRNLSRRNLKIEPFVVTAASVPGIDVRIPKPTEAGADRLVNAIGAYSVYGGPLIVIDSGTATNFDIVAKDGAFVGGIIAPGINLSMQALHEAAALLPRIAIERPEQIIGRDTVGAMKTGIFWGYVDLIDGLTRRIIEEYGEPMKVVATGGVSSLFEGALSTVDYFDADLTIRGLLEIHHRLNTQSLPQSGQN